MPFDLERVRSQLNSAILSDALDAAGYRAQVMHPGIRPLDDRTVLCGRARTGLYRATDGVQAGKNPYELEIKLVDSLKPGELVALATGESRCICPWGELLSTAATARGAVGCITDGLSRDVARIRDMRFPVFCGGISPLDAQGRGEISAIDIPVVVGGIRVFPGDLVFGDVDGALVVPCAIEEEVLAHAFAKMEGENTTRAEILNGSLLADVFSRHGIL